MDQDELKLLIVKLAGVADRLDERSESAVRRVEQTGVLIDRRAQSLGSGADSFTRSALQTIDAQAAGAMDRGIGRSVEACSAQLRDAAQVASDAARELQRAQQVFQRERRTWIWLGSGTLIVGSLLSIAATAYAVKTSREQIDRNRIEASLLRAYNQADVTLCNDRLCANVDSKAERFGDQKQYQLVKPR